MNLGFERYPSLKRFGTTEVAGLESGEVYIFPKIDGTNASVWLDSAGGVQAGSRNRHLDESSDGDNAGFCKYIRAQENIKDFLVAYPHIRLFGEWLVPHSIKTYREDAWRKFYVFDVFDMEKESFVSYDEYKPLMEQYNIEYVPVYFKAKVVTIDKLIELHKHNTYLIAEGQGVGEGWVIKNYEFINKYGRCVWGKFVSNEFKEKNAKEFGHQNITVECTVEEKIIDKFFTEAFVEKEFAKMTLNNPWETNRIPELLSRIWHEFITEEPVNFIKTYKNPTINFKVLNNLAIQKIKKVKSDLF